MTFRRSKTVQFYDLHKLIRKQPPEIRSVFRGWIGLRCVKI